MKVFVPWYTTKWIIEKVETDDLHELGRGGSGLFTKVRNGEHHGTIYHNPFYKSVDAVNKFINKEYVTKDETIFLGGAK